MTPRFKKVLSVVLSLIMAFSVFSIVGMAAPEDASPTLADMIPQSATGEAVPTIIIPGISQSPATYCDENGEPILDANGHELSGGMLIIDSSNIVGSILKKLLMPLLKSLIMRKADSKLAGAVYDVICDLFSIQATDKTGHAVNNLVLETYNVPLSQFPENGEAENYNGQYYTKDRFYRFFPMEPLIEKMNEVYGVDGEEYVYLYTFPLIGDPMTAGEGLFDYIEMVKEQSGCDKVNLVPISLGGTVLTAYCDLVMERGGDFSDINNIVNVVACLNGTDLFADFYARNWNLSDEFLFGAYVPAILAENGMDEYVGHLINIVLKMLPKDVLYTILTGAMDGILDTLLINCPQFWAMVPSDRYDVLAERYLSAEDMAVVRAQTDRFQQAKLNLNANLKYANENYAVGVFTVSGYGRDYTTGDYSFLGIAKSSLTANSDSIIDIDSTSLGASYAPVGQTLVNGTSPDKEIDATTCLFPDTAWFFYGQHHEVGRDDVVIKLIANIICEQVTDVHSSAAFPQYNYNRNTRTLVRADGLMNKAETVLANADGEYTQSQIDTVKPAYEKAAAMLANTVMTADSAAETDAVTTALNDALVCTGLTSKTKKTNVFVKFLNKLTAALDK